MSYKPTSMSATQVTAVIGVTNEVIAERFAQHEKWGEQNHPSFPPLAGGFSAVQQRDEANAARQECQDAFENGTGSYYHILNEELAEAYAEANNPMELRKEPIQVAAVAVAWIKKIDRDMGNGEG